MKLLIAFLLLVTSAISASQENGGAADEVVINRYKLSAVTGIGSHAISRYLKDPHPKRRCVLITLGAEFSADFVFFAQTDQQTFLEVICFTPRTDGKKEWAGRFVKFEGGPKDQFQKLRELLSTEADLPKIDWKEEGLVLGGDQLDFQVGEGPKIGWGELTPEFLSKHPERQKRLLECLKIAEDLAGIPLPHKLD